MSFSARRFGSAVLPLLLLTITTMLPCCASSDASRNPQAGVDHPQIKESKHWAPGTVRPWSQHAAKHPVIDTPKGLFFPASGGEKAARATFLCLHGIQTHSVWFEPLARELTAAGMNVIAVDRRGSGMNTADPFVKGDARSEVQLLNDLEYQILTAQALGKPVYLVGTSWSSNLAGTYTVSGRRPQPDGLVLLVPATRSRFEKPLLTAVVRGLASIFPRFEMRLPFGNKHYQAGEPQADPSREGVSKQNLGKPGSKDVTYFDPVLTDWLDQDEKSGLLLLKPSCRLVKIGLQMATTWQSHPAGTPQIPQLIICAGCDQIMDNGATYRAAFQQEQTHTAQPAPVTWRVLPDAGHGAQITHAREISRHVLDWLPGHPR